MMTQIYKNEPLNRHTSFRIGGKADRLVYPETEREISEWYAEKEPRFVLGGGSNLLVGDKGVRGIVLSVEKGLRRFRVAGTDPDGTVRVRVQAGHHLTGFATAMMRKGLSGIEFAYGIPGTHLGEMKDVVGWVSLVTSDGEVVHMENAEIGFRYRASAFPPDSLILETEIRLKEGKPADIFKRMKESQKRRKQTQPLSFPSAGSIFKNPAGDYAGRIIESLGMKGFSVGDAQVSMKHANFIVNLGNATSAQVLELIERIEEKVFAETGVRLEREVRLVGEF
jgi:UDP-N-acetylmuramate dehydrogenase